MCGIIAAFNYGEKKENVNKWVEYQLEDQISRGKDGFGIITIDKNLKVQTERATEMIKALLDLRFNESKMIIMHHRTPTSSENKISQTHPIKVHDGSLKYDYLVVHNGIINNEDEIKKMHEELGFVYNTVRQKNSIQKEFNDSETIAIELARFIEGQTEKIAVKGSAAYIVLQINKKTNKAVKLFFGRNTNPLFISKTRNKLRLSSEGEGNPVKENIIYSCNLKNFNLSKKKCVIEQYTQTTKSWNSSDFYDIDQQYESNFNYKQLPTEKIKEEIIEECSSNIEDCLDSIIREIEIEGIIDDKTTDEYIKVICSDISDLIIKNKNKLTQAVADELIEEATLFPEETYDKNQTKAIGFNIPNKRKNTVKPTTKQ